MLSFRELLAAHSILGRLHALEQNQRYIMAALDDLKAADAKLGTSVANAIKTINDDTTKLADLAAQVAAGQGDPAAVSALAADISAKADALDQAVNPTPAPNPNSNPAPAVGTGGQPVT